MIDDKQKQAATPAVDGEDQFHPGKCLPDCMMPDGGECCPGYVALYDAYWHLVRVASSASPAMGRDLFIRAVDEMIDERCVWDDVHPALRTAILKNIADLAFSSSPLKQLAAEDK